MMSIMRIFLARLKLPLTDPPLIPILAWQSSTQIPLTQVLQDFGRKQRHLIYSRGKPLPHHLQLCFLLYRLKVNISPSCQKGHLHSFRFLTQSCQSTPLLFHQATHQWGGAVPLKWTKHKVSHHPHCSHLFLLNPEKRTTQWMKSRTRLLDWTGNSAEDNTTTLCQGCRYSGKRHKTSASNSFWMKNAAKMFWEGPAGAKMAGLMGDKEGYNKVPATISLCGSALPLKERK